MEKPMKEIEAMRLEQAKLYLHKAAMISITMDCEGDEHALQHSYIRNALAALNGDSYTITTYFGK